MNMRNMLAVLQKELLEIVRDRRTMISMVVIPMLAIPLMFRMMSFFTSSNQKEAAEQAMTVAISNEANVQDILPALVKGGFKTVVKSDLRDAVQKKETAAGIDETESNGVKQINLYMDRTRQASDIAYDKLRTLLDKAKDASVKERLRGSNLPESILTPFKVERVNVASEKKMSGFMLGMILSYMMVLLMFTGAMYPAIDMTAGEKERRTMEALLGSPASRLDLVMGKVLAAATAAFVTAILTLVSMAYSVRYLPQPKDSPFSFKMAPDAQMFALVLLVMLPTAIMGAALMVGIALFAKSYKEGQSYLMPVILLVSFSAVAGMLPGAELSTTVALVPIFNSCQIVKQIFLGEMSTGMFALVVAVNIVYAVIAFIGAAQLFKKETVLFRV
jgi:sodium transport system permease protein